MLRDVKNTMKDDSAMGITVKIADNDSTLLQIGMVRLMMTKVDATLVLVLIVHTVTNASMKIIPFIDAVVSPLRQIPYRHIRARRSITVTNWVVDGVNLPQ